MGSFWDFAKLALIVGVNRLGKHLAQAFDFSCKGSNQIVGGIRPIRAKRARRLWDSH